MEIVKILGIILKMMTVPLSLTLLFYLQWMAILSDLQSQEPLKKRVRHMVIALLSSVGIVIQLAALWKIVSDTLPWVG